MRGTLQHRFDAKVERIPFHTCWEWTGARIAWGYGLIGVDGKNRLAHRVAWELSCGPIPPGANVLHRCDNPSCVRPDHLFLGSQRDNMADKVNKGRCGDTKAHHPATGERHGSRTHPESVPRGDLHPSRLHPETRPRGEDNAMHKLTEEQVRQIRGAATRGVTQRQIARLFGTHQTNVSMVVRRKTWAHVA